MHRYILMSIVQVAVHHFSLENHMKLPGKFGMGGKEKCITGHNIMLKIFQVFTVFWDWEWYFPKNFSHGNEA